MWWNMIWPAKQISQTLQWWESMTTRRQVCCSFYIVLMLLKEIPFRSVLCFLLTQTSFCCWFIISQNWRHVHYSKQVEEINSVISTSANATKQLDRYERQNCLVFTLWLDVIKQDGSMERPNRFGGSKFIVQEKMF